MASLEQVEKIRANIFKDAWKSIPDWQEFPWHLGRDGAPDSHVAHSSQAFCISVWGSISGSVSTVLRTQISELAESPVSDAFREAPEVEFEYSDRSLLNEYGGIPTTIDVLATWSDLVLVVESKVTESLGSCSQPSRGLCTGLYGSGSDLKTGTSALCRLEIQDGSRAPRTYWEVMKSLAKPDAFPEGVPCPFAGQAYQVMRNVAAAYVLGSRLGREWYVLFSLPAASSNDAVEAIEYVRGLLRQENLERIGILDYQELASRLLQTNAGIALAEHMISRLPEDIDA